MEAGDADHSLKNRFLFRILYPFGKARDDPIHRAEILVDHFAGCLPLYEPFLIAQVLERRAPADPRQHTCQRMFRRSKVKVRNPGNPTDFVEVATPVPLCPCDQRKALFTDVKRLAQKNG